MGRCKNGVWNSYEPDYGQGVRMGVPDEKVTDADGSVYTTVRIGNQVWTVENLRATKYNDGTPIPLVTSDSEWSNLRTGAYCFLYNVTDPDYRKECGALYNWYAIGTGRLAPRGWHVPTVSEWTKLQEHLIAAGCNWDGTKEGNKIAKALAASKGWAWDADAGSESIGISSSKNNRSGFSAIGSGTRYYDGHFRDRERDAFWWTAEECEHDASCAWTSGLTYNQENLCRGRHRKQCGLSVRLLRD
jgi:uncharacterized protein (TIGR02145 family)